MSLSEPCTRTFCCQNSTQQHIKSIMSKDNFNMKKYGLMMKNFNRNGQNEKTLKLFDEIILKNEINMTEVIYLLAIGACTNMKNLQRGKQIHRKMVNSKNESIKNVIQLQNALINMYAKCNDVKNAELIFQQMEQRDIITFNCMLKGYTVSNMANKAIELAKSIEQQQLKFSAATYNLVINACIQIGNSESFEKGKHYYKQLLQDEKIQLSDNIILQTSLIDLYGKSGDVEMAEKIFNDMNNRNVITYSALMKCYNLNGLPHRSIEIYKNTKQQFIVNDVLVINACAQLGFKKLLENIHEQIPKQYVHHNLILQTSLIDAYSKCGDVKTAENIFSSTSKRDIITYCAMINGYGVNGYGLEAVSLFYKMINEAKIIPDQQTYVCVLNACSHSGLVGQAESIFQSIEYKDEKVYTAMIDTLARVYRFDKAQLLIDEYEQQQGNKSYLPMYMALLSGARNNNNNLKAKEIYNKLCSIPNADNNTLLTASVLLSNTYSAYGNYEEATKVREQQLVGGVKKAVGVSLTLVNGQIFEFKAHDRRHPLSNKIYEELDKMTEELKQDGYECDTRWTTRAPDPGESIESVLCGHSERLALAFNFISSPTSPQMIQITKNLRVCGDCHDVTKRISKIRQCEIIVRDKNRIHHFKDGYCSCREHF
ncbi:unnamed protein product [Didymodactylos carnosus]|uniref:DYW domain-containing protein n=1 Tax=Didymodactylos carnosus TaxID=1234261 RepID=A0A8S2III8_9BILA|nr:unnamed protein product [Didymodactylos carnosus]CAF3758079.1 unnamed protein product [Didymodactylos carnosus]